MEHPRTGVNPERRRLVAGIAGVVALHATELHAWAADAERSLAFYHTHTGERLDIPYFAGGEYLVDALFRIDHLLRDFRTGEIHPIDARLLDTLFAVRRVCGAGTFEVISGYRSTATNALLQSRGEGVAPNSLHLEGRAIDIRLTGFETAKLRDAANALSRGGVGYYAASDFIHLDTGRVRTW